MTDSIDKIQEQTIHGGLASPFVLVSRNAKIEKDSYATGNAEVLGEAQVLGYSAVREFGKVMDKALIHGGSTVNGHARVSGAARVVSSTISGTAEVMGDAFIRDSIIDNNAIVSGMSLVEMSNIGCNARVLDNAKLYNVYFRWVANKFIGNTICIEGDAELAFSAKMELSPGTRIHEGYWTRPPLVIDTPYFPMIEGVGDRVQIGCRNRPISFWYDKGLRELTKYGLNPALYDVFIDALKKMEAHKNELGSPDNVRRRTSQ